MLDQIPEILRTKGFLTKSSPSRSVSGRRRTQIRESIEFFSIRDGASEENYLRAMAEELGFGFTDLSDRKPDEEAIRLTTQPVRLQKQGLSRWRLRRTGRW